MSREEYIRGSLALVMTELLVPLVRDAVLADVGFAAKVALTSNATVTFKPANVSRSVYLAQSERRQNDLERRETLRTKLDSPGH